MISLRRNSLINYLLRYRDFLNFRVEMSVGRLSFFVDDSTSTLGLFCNTSTEFSGVKPFWFIFRSEICFSLLKFFWAPPGTTTRFETSESTSTMLAKLSSSSRGISRISCLTSTSLDTTWSNSRFFTVSSLILMKATSKIVKMSIFG